MQTKSGPLNDVSNLINNALGAVKGVGDELKAVGRAQGEKLIADMDLVSRDEFEVLAARLEATQARVDELEARLSKLEKKPKTKPAR